MLTVEWIVLLFCVVIAALASGTETAMTSISRLRVRHLAEEGGRAGAMLQRLQQDPNRFLSTVLVANTVALIVASSMATLISVQLLPASFGFWGDLGASLLLSVFLLIFSEVTPKSLAIRNAERLALLAAGPIDGLSRVLRPVLWFITIIARLVTGGRAAHAPYLTEQELMTVLHVSEEQGVIEEEEREMIHGIIEIGDKAVREVMVPRTHITALPRESSLADISRVFGETKHTRIPVFEQDLDHIVGLIHVKDLLGFYSNGGTAAGRTFNLARIMRRIQFTPESKKVDELLHHMQTEKVHMMVVIDEYGGTAGLVTLEDLLEEIVGEIRDEYDSAEEDLLKVPAENEAVVDARYPMDELNERLGLGIAESTEYDSVGGFIYSQVGDVPVAGTAFEAGGVSWTVEEVDGQRIVSARLRATRPWPDEILVDAGFAPPSRDEDAGGAAGHG